MRVWSKYLRVRLMCIISFRHFDLTSTMFSVVRQTQYVICSNVNYLYYKQ